MQIIYWHEYAAAITTVLTILAFTPQIFKVFKLKSGKTLSPTSFLVSYSGSVVLSIFSSIHSPFVWTTLIVDLTIAFLVMPILYFIFRDHFGKNKVKPLMALILLINISVVIIFILTRVGTIPTGLTKEGEMIMAIIGFSLTGFAFFPQTLMIIKNRQIGDYSMLLAITYGVAQSLNVVFWTGRQVVDHQDMMDYMPGLVLAGVSALIQFSTLLIVTIYKYQNKRAAKATR